MSNLLEMTPLEDRRGTIASLEYRGLPLYIIIGEPYHYDYRSRKPSYAIKAYPATQYKVVDPGRYKPVDASINPDGSI